MRVIQLAGICGLIFTGGSLTLARAEAAPALYTSAQVATGAGVFAQNCAVCHGANLQGDEGPTLVGQKFSAHDTGNTIGSIFSLITQQMPLSNPASLSQSQYEDVMAFLLNKNGYPSGNVALSAATSAVSSVPFISAVK